MRTDDFRQTASTADSEITIDWLATPGRVFSHPRDVLDHPALDPSEKRAILASWASDARAVENEPSLRQIDCGAHVPLSEILSALRSLDHVVPSTPATRVIPGRRARPIRIDHLQPGQRD